MGLLVDRDWYKSPIGRALLCGESGTHDAVHERHRLSEAYARRGDTFTEDGPTSEADTGSSGDTHGNTRVEDVRIRRSLSVGSLQYAKHRSLRRTRGRALPGAEGAVSRGSGNSVQRDRQRDGRSHTDGDRIDIDSSCSENGDWPISCGISLLLPEWRVRLHGKAAAGKTAIVDSLCGRTSCGPYRETPGLEIRCTVVPVKVRHCCSSR